MSKWKKTPTLTGLKISKRRFWAKAEEGLYSKKMYTFLGFLKIAKKAHVCLHPLLSSLCTGYIPCLGENKICRGLRILSHQSFSRQNQGNLKIFKCWQKYWLKRKCLNLVSPFNQKLLQTSVVHRASSDQPSQSLKFFAKKIKDNLWF